MMLLLKKQREYRADTTLIITIVPLILFVLGLLLLRPLAAFAVSLCEFYLGRLIGKPTSFLQLQKLRLRDITRTCSVSNATLPTSSSNLSFGTSSPRPLPYVLTSTPIALL
jgi:hypothetical protein